MNVYDIVKEYLQSHGYDGLVGLGCACLLDDLAPCGKVADCVPGVQENTDSKRNKE